MKRLKRLQLRKKASAEPVKVRILTELVGSYGKFRPGVYELDAELAQQFINDKVAEAEK